MKIKNILLFFVLISVLSTSISALTYTYINFTTPGTGTWTVPSGINNITLLVVAGGGGGGGMAGGGAGGVIFNKSYSITPGAVINYKVGAKGTNGVGGPGRGNNGGNSWFGTSNATGGGG
jgi:hypothetical protein